MDHQLVLTTALRAALADADLKAIAQDDGLDPLVGHNGEPVVIDTVKTLAEENFWSLNPGVVVRLSDGSAFTIAVALYRHPRDHMLM